MEDKDLRDVKTKTEVVEFPWRDTSGKGLSEASRSLLSRSSMAPTPPINFLTNGNCWRCTRQDWPDSRLRENACGTGWSNFVVSGKGALCGARQRGMVTYHLSVRHEIYCEMSVVCTTTKRHKNDRKNKVWHEKTNIACNERGGRCTLIIHTWKYYQMLKSAASITHDKKKCQRWLWVIRMRAYK